MQRKLVCGPPPAAPPSSPLLAEFPLPLVQISSTVRYLPPRFLEGPSPFCSYCDQAASLVACQPLLQWTDWNPPFSTSLLPLYCKEWVKCSAFPHAGAFLWLIPAPAAPRQHLGAQPAQLSAYADVHTLRSRFQLLALAFVTLLCLCTRNSLWFPEVQLSLLLAPRSVLVLQGTAAPVAPGAPRAQPCCCASICISYHCGKIIPECWNITERTWDLQVEASFSFIFAFFAFWPHQPMYRS